MTAAVSSGDALRADIVAEARRWLGTPYHHRAALRGVGCDCLGLVRGVWREVLGLNVLDLPSYTGDWGDVTGVEVLLNGLATHLIQVHPRKAVPGDILAFRIRSGRIAKHCAILSTPTAFIHAWEATPVTEGALSDWWSARVVMAFRARRLGTGEPA